MEWYWWVLIAVGVVGVGYLKLKLGGKMLASMKAKRAAEQAALDDE